MKNLMKPVWKYILMCVGLAMIPIAVMASKAGAEDEMIGAKVFGPSNLSVGDVVGILRNEHDGSAMMYVIDADGLFNGRGIVPLSAVLDERSRPQKGGKVSYELVVDVNRATFKNIANWERDEPLSSYVSRQSHILKTLFGLDEKSLESAAQVAYLDDGKVELESRDDIAGL